MIYQIFLLFFSKKKYMLQVYENQYIEKIFLLLIVQNYMKIYFFTNISQN
jgi:hypothetical protein